MKKIIRLTEGDLHRIIENSVRRVLKEGRGRFGNLVDMVTDKFNQFYAAHPEETDKHIEAVKESGEFNDLETRLAWDIARAAKYRNWLPQDEQGYVIGNDAQLTTLFKQALRNSDIEY